MVQEQDQESVVKQAVMSLEEAKSITITSAESYLEASTFLKQIKGIKDKVLAFFGPMKAKAHESHQTIVHEEKKALAPIADAEKLVKGCMIKYTQEQDRIRQKEQERLRKIEEEKQQQELVDEAINLMEKGAKEAEVVALVTKPLPDIYIPPPTTKAAPKVSGISYRDVWKFEVVDKRLLPNEYLMADEARIGQVVRSLKGETTIPGIKIWCEKVASVTA